MWSGLMMRVFPNGYLLTFCFAFIFTASVPLGLETPDDSAKRAADQNVPLIHSLQGPDLFRSFCASCHGLDGKGNGPVTPALNTRVPDLTLIAQRHGGVFPEKWVRGLIAGDPSIVAHGNREMPIWGPIFHQIENDHDYGEVRLRNLTEYLRTLQQK
jgi:mono/diheme cytochrome c family protein